jgi:dUTP pyrophosphatase
MQTIKIAKLDPKAFLPTRKHPSDAGLDIYANVKMTITAHSFAIVSSGITIEIDPGFVGLLKPKGRNNHLLGAGVVDAGYQGEILVKVANPTDQPLEINPGDAIGQMVILPIYTPVVEEVSIDQIHRDNSSRGNSGGIVDQHQLK